MYKFCNICGEMKQFSHKLHMIIEKKKEGELDKLMKGYNLNV